MQIADGYQQTAVGVIPEDWGLVPFADLFSFQNGANADKDAYGHGTPFINVLEVLTQTHIATSHIPGRVALSRSAIESYGVRYGDVVFNRTSETQEDVGLASVYVGADEIVFGGFVIRGRPKNDTIDPIYSGYGLRSVVIRDQIVARGQGAIRSNIGQSDLKTVVVPLPPPEEQRAIAEALSDVDSLNASLDALITKKRQIKQGTMQQLLTGKTRLPGFSGEWREKTFGQLFNFSGGYTASREQLSSDGHCYLHYGDIHGTTKTYVDTDEDFQNIPKLDIALKDVSSVSLLDDGDVVFVDASEDVDGASRHVVIVNKECMPFISGLHTIVAKSKSDDLVNDYKRFCLQTVAIKKQFLFYAVGTKVTGISKSNIPKLVLPVPSRDEQIAIAEVLSDMDAEITALEQKRDKTRMIKQGMMQELLTGKSRLVV